MSGEREGVDREEIARLTDKLHGLARMAKEMGAIASDGIAAIDDHVVAEHPDLDDLGHEMRNVYGDAFDDGPGDAHPA